MKHSSICVVIALVAFFAGCSGSGKHRSFGKLAYTSGTARVFEAAKGSWMLADNGMTVFSGDSIETSKESEAVVTFGNSSIKLSENTEIAISDTVDTQNKRLIAVLNLKGEILSDVKDIEKKGAQYEVWTPTAVAHAEGTHFIVTFSPQPYVTNVRVLDGRVRVFNPFVPSAPQVFVVPGCFTTVAYNAAPAAAAPMSYGQYKKMQPLLGPRYYHVYEARFKIDPVVMALDAPIVMVPVITPPLYIPPVPRMHHGPHGRLIVEAPFLLPPGPGLPLPGVPLPGEMPFPQSMPHPGMMPVPHAVPHPDVVFSATHGRSIGPIPPMVPQPHFPHGGMSAPVPPGAPVHPFSGVAPSPIGPIPVPHGRIFPQGRIGREGHDHAENEQRNDDNGNGGQDKRRGRHR